MYFHLAIYTMLKSVPNYNQARVVFYYENYKCITCTDKHTTVFIKPYNFGGMVHIISSSYNMQFCIYVNFSKTHITYIFNHHYNVLNCVHMSMEVWNIGMQWILIVPAYSESGYSNCLLIMNCPN